MQQSLTNPFLKKMTTNLNSFFEIFETSFSLLDINKVNILFKIKITIFKYIFTFHEMNKNKSGYLIIPTTVILVFDNLSSLLIPDEFLLFIWRDYFITNY